VRRCRFYGQLSGRLAESECDFEVFILRVEGNVLDFDLCDVASNSFFNFLDALVDVIGRTLSEHFDIAISDVADKTGQLIVIGCTEGCEAKANALNAAGKDYMFRNLVHYILC